MGQKVHPTGFRVGIKVKVPNRVKGTNNIIDWSSRWYAKKGQYGDLLIEDQKIREFIKWGNKKHNIYTRCISSGGGPKEKKANLFAGFYYAGIPQIEIERLSGVDFNMNVRIHIARPGLIIGRKGKKIETLTDDLQKITGKTVKIDIVEVKDVETNAQLVGENIAEQLEKRASFRRVMKRSVETALNAGVQGIKIQVSGRLGGAEMARAEAISRGKIPLQTLRADINYGFAEANTAYGNIGVKVWLYKGDVISNEEIKNAATKKS